MTTPKAEKEHDEGQQSSSSESTVANMPPSSNPSSSPNMSTKPLENDKIGLRHRVKHFTFAWFLCTMSTGGLSIALAETPHKFRGA
jgi:hypothetical protein